MKKVIIWAMCAGLVGCSSIQEPKGLVQNSAPESCQYFDYAASAHINPYALVEFARVSQMDGNSSGFNLHAQKLQAIERNAHETIGSKINAEGDNIIFTNSATMSNNIAILGAARKYPKCHLITSKIEHKSVLNVFKQLEKEGHEVTYLDVDEFGYVDLDQLEDSIKKNTKLVSIQMVNSEIGTLQDMEEIGDITSRRGVLFHSDASQAFGKYPIDVEKFHLDLLTVSGYKIGAPKGIAALYVRDRTKLKPVLFGSGCDLFPGTKPTALIASFAKAAEAYSLDMPKIVKNYNALHEEIQKIDDIHINSDEPSHVFSVSIGGVLLGDILERIGNYSFSAGCSCLGMEPSNVMEAIDPEGKIPTCTLRISFSDQVQPQQLIDFARHLKEVVEQLRKEKAVGPGCGKKKSSELSKILEKINKRAS